jgi:hypothetical protein
MTGTDPWAASTAALEALQQHLAGPEAAAMMHGDIEELIRTQIREVARLLFQGHQDLRAEREPRLPEVVDAEGVRRGTAVHGESRNLATVFGDVSVSRIAYRQPGQANLFPADARQNLPQEQFSHGLRRIAAVEASKVSFGEAVLAVRAQTAAPKIEVGQRQLEDLVRRAAVDFDAFYAQAERPAAGTQAVLALSFDGKGVVMRPEALRAGTAAAAARATPTFATRLSQGEKANRKRMAEVAAVFDVEPVPRTPEDILPLPDNPKPARPKAPHASGKWVTASVVDDMDTVVAQGFAEAQRRDPKHRRTWLALVDGNNEQLRHIRKHAKAGHVDIVILVDFIHVLEYLWKAAWCFFDDKDPAAETWVRTKALEVLRGKSALVGAAVRRKATAAHLAPHQRKAADTCADYLKRKRAYLDYPTALANGWPIATGVIEGTCRHLVKDRMDIAGARWGLDSAEAVLKLRALRTNGDFDHYWSFHLTQEQVRVHASRYLGSIIPGSL